MRTKKGKMKIAKCFNEFDPNEDTESVTTARARFFALLSFNEFDPNEDTESLANTLPFAANNRVSMNSIRTRILKVHFNFKAILRIH